MNAVSDFFTSLKEDLLGKRLLPFLLVLGVALVAAVAYAVLGGGSSATADPGHRVRSRRRLRGGWGRVRQPGAGEPQPAGLRDHRRHVQAAPRDPRTTRSRRCPAAKTASSASTHVEHDLLLQPIDHAFSGIDSLCLELRRHDPHAAEGNNAGEAQGLRPLPRDRAARRRAAVGRRRAGAARAAEDLQGHGARRTASRTRPTRSSCSSVWCCAPARKRCSGSPARRSCTGAAAASRARRSARRSSCRSGRARRSKSSKPTAARSPTN